MGDSTEPPWRTAISQADDETVNYRGYDLLDIMGELDFASTVYLVAKGELPSDGEATVLNALLVSSVDHGISPSQAVSRYITASGSPVQAAVAGGLLTYGDHHGGASSITADMFQTALTDLESEESLSSAADSVVDAYLDEGDPVPGYHHPMHPDGDPRAARLLTLADENGVSGEATALARAIEESLLARTGSELKLNMDGAAAAAVLDLGLSPTFARGVFLIARSAGLVAHSIEEATREDIWRQVSGEVTYDGPADRNLPDR